MQNQSNTDDVKDSGSGGFFTPKRKRLIAMLVFLIAWGSCVALFFHIFQNLRTRRFRPQFRLKLQKKKLMLTPN